MESLRGLKDFLWRHKGKISAAAVLAGGAVVGRRVLEWKMEEEQQQLLADHTELARRRVMYERNESASGTAAEAVLETTKQAVEEAHNSNRLIAQLKLESEAARTMEGVSQDGVYARWDQVKVVVVAELVTSAYTLSFLVTYLRLSFNIMGGYLCRQHVDPTAPRLSIEVQQAYVELAEHLQTHGIAAMVPEITAAVKKVFGASALQIKESPKLRQAEFNKYLAEVRQLFEGKAVMGSGFFASFLLGRTVVEPTARSADSPAAGETYLTLEHLVNETKDMIDTTQFADALHDCLSVCFGHVDTNLGILKFSSAGNAYTEVALAKLVPVIHRQALGLFNPEKGAIKELLGSSKLESFSSSVYDTFCSA